MISLPPGCRVVYGIYIDIDRLTDDFIEWYKTIGGEVKHDQFYNTRGNMCKTPYVRYGKGKWCHHHQNGAGGTRLHFMGEDDSVASMCLLKFTEHVTNHNMQEAIDRYQREMDAGIF